SFGAVHTRWHTKRTRVRLQRFYSHSFVEPPGEVPQMGHAVQFRLLGPVEFRVRGEPRALGGPRQRAVLAALLLRANEEVRSSQLLELVWSDVPSSAESNLRTYLTRLRRILHV